MIIEKGKIVTMHYTLKDNTGKVLESTRNGKPYEFICGEGMIVPGLEKALIGLKPGDKKEVVVPSEEAYGDYQKDSVLKVHRDQLQGEDIAVGKEFRRIFSDGRSEVFKVKGFVDEWVYLDKNHPWAGKELHYEVEILDVRPRNI